MEVGEKNVPKDLDVIGVGALNIDRLHTVQKIAGAGEEVAISSRSVSCGGSAANTIVALARLGVSTGFIGRVGSDEDGAFILQDLRREGVDTGGVEKSRAPTGLILGFVDSQGERALYALPGANNELRINKKNLAYAKRAKYLHLSSFVGERSYEAQRELLKRLQGVKISFAPGMLYARRCLAEMNLIIERCEVIFLNREETRLLTGSEYQRGAQMLLSMGAKIVAITLGSEGCYVAAKERAFTSPAFKTRVIDTTGAGDAFAAGFLYGLLKEMPPESCAKLANKLAALCVAKMGAREGLPKEREIKSFIGQL